MLNIDSIENGIVIDHITAGLGMRIYELLELDKLDTCVAIIKNAKSEKYGKKDIIKIEGSVELAPLLGLSDGIVDIVETGATLRENGLEVIERVADVSARLIVNAASLKLRKREIEALAARLEREIKKGEQ